MQNDSCYSDNIINETGAGNCISWFDEQDTALIPHTRWETPGNTAYWPASLVIDWGQRIRIKRIAIYDDTPSDYNGSSYEHREGALELQTGEPFQWKVKMEIPMQNEGRWKYIETDFVTRYIRLLKKSLETYNWQDQGPFMCDVNINEVIFYGTPVQDDPEPCQASAPEGQPKYTMDEMIGVNTFCYDSPEFQRIFGMLREYQPWQWFGVHSLTDSFRWIAPKTFIPKICIRPFPEKYAWTCTGMWMNKYG